MDIDIIGKIPLEKEIIKCCEAGTPSCIKFPESSFSETYRNISRNIIQYLDELNEIIKNKSSIWIRMNLFGFVVGNYFL